MNSSAPMSGRTRAPLSMSLVTGRLGSAERFVPFPAQRPSEVPRRCRSSAPSGRVLKVGRVGVHAGLAAGARRRRVRRDVVALGGGPVEVLEAPARQHGHVVRGDHGSGGAPDAVARVVVDGVVVEVARAARLAHRHRAQRRVVHVVQHVVPDLRQHRGGVDPREVAGVVDDVVGDVVLDRRGRERLEDTPPAPLGAAERLPSISIPSILTKLSLTRMVSLSRALVGRRRNPVRALPVWRWLAPTWLPRTGV